MHILILPSWYVSSYNALQGVFFKEQAEALVKHGQKVGVITLQDVGMRNIVKQKKLDFLNKSFVENGVHTYRFQYLDILKIQSLTSKIKMAFFKRMFKKYIKDHGLPDIVHLHSFMVGDWAMYLKDVYSIPYVVTEHGTGFARDTFSLNDLDKAKMVFEKSEYNIAVSKQFGNLLEDKFNLNFSYIPNIVNIDFFNIKESAEKDTYNFINIAFLTKKKNQDVLIRAFSYAFKNRADIKLTIAGYGTEYDNLDKLIKELNMEDQISLFGRASREEVKMLLQKSDTFVLSSQYETFGVVIIEAMACGLPVLATKCGGPESIINSDEVGLLSEIDESSLSEKLLEMYNKRSDFNAHYIRKYVENNFSEEAVCLKLKKIYEKVLK